MFTALKSATIQINTRAKNAMTEEVLLGILQGHIDPKPWHYHINTLFSELPVPHLLRLVAEQKLQKKTLQTVCEALPAPYSTDCRVKIDTHLETASC